MENALLLLLSRFLLCLLASLFVFFFFRRKHLASLAGAITLCTPVDATCNSGCLYIYTRTPFVTLLSSIGASQHTYEELFAFWLVWALLWL